MNQQLPLRSRATGNLYLDIETLNAIPTDKDLTQVQFGIAVTHFQNRWRTFKPDESMELWYQLCNADHIVGWNIIHFDLPIIARAVGITHPDLTDMFRAWPVYDLFDEIRTASKRWYKLDEVAQYNGLEPKTAHGLQAVLWLQEWQRTGDERPLRDALEYCQHDVQLVIDLTDKLKDGGRIKLPARTRRNEGYEMTFSLPLEKEMENK